MDFDFKETFLSPAIIFDFKIVVACVKMLIIFADCRASHRQHCLVTSNVFRNFSKTETLLAKVIFGKNISIV